MITKEIKTETKEGEMGNALGKRVITIKLFGKLIIYKEIEICD